MPKMKTHSGSKKRFRVSPNGKVKYKIRGARHLMTGDSGNESRRLRKTAILDKTETRSIKKRLPYAF